MWRGAPPAHTQRSPRRAPGEDGTLLCVRSLLLWLQCDTSAINLCGGSNWPAARRTFEAGTNFRRGHCLRDCRLAGQASSQSFCFGSISHTAALHGTLSCSSLPPSVGFVRAAACHQREATCLPFAPSLAQGAVFAEGVERSMLERTYLAPFGISG